MRVSGVDDGGDEPVHPIREERSRDGFPEVHTAAVERHAHLRVGSDAVDGRHLLRSRDAPGERDAHVARQIHQARHAFQVAADHAALALDERDEEPADVRS